MRALPPLRHLRITTIAVVLVLAATAATAQPAGKKHPRLASAKASCATCHGDLTADKKVIHAAADDCTNCHTVATVDGATTVALNDADPTLCLNCHDGLAAAVEGTVAAPHPVVADGCLTCHAPHAGDEPKLLLSRQAELCGNCHDAATLAPKHGELLTAATTCTSCHLPHGGAIAKLLNGKVKHSPFEEASCNGCHRPNFGERIRLQARGQRLCLACHDDPAALEDKKSTHAALADDAKGRAGCLSCHDPHLSPQPRMLVAGGVDLCARCHAPVVAAAKVKTGHAAAADDCANCHLPHAGAQPKLLKVATTELCAECHDTGDAELAKTHLGADLAKLACLSCHSPHGAGQPKLLAANVHPPVLEGCDTCHTGAFNQLEEKGESPLCLNCHSEIGEAAAAAPVKHEAMEAGSCVVCHNPHATPRPKLVRAAADGCGSCHSDKIPEEGEVSHGVIDLIGCQACHEPHGGAKAKLLRAEGASLCLACHGEATLAAATAPGGAALEVFDRFEIAPDEAKKIRPVRLSPSGDSDHPNLGHRALGAVTEDELQRTETTFRGELTCLTCHNPHKGRSARLLAWDAGSPTEACMHCHPK